MTNKTRCQKPLSSVKKRALGGTQAKPITNTKKITTSKLVIDNLSEFSNTPDETYKHLGTPAAPFPKDSFALQSQLYQGQNPRHEVETIYCLSELTPESNSACPLHDEKTVEAFCSECKHELCIECILTNRHKGHDMLSIA